MHIALLEDDVDQRDLACLWLECGAHSVSVFGTVVEMVDALKVHRFDLLLLDWMLPDGNGGEVVQWVRANQGWSVPIIVLTSRDDEATVVQALGSGADDYLVKPAKQQELLARIVAVTRRTQAGGLPVLRMGVYEIDVTQHRLSMDKVEISLTQKEFELSVYLFQNPGKLLSRDHLLNRVWGMNAEVDTRTVDTHVSRLRKKLKLDGNSGWKLQPVYGYGYRLDRIDVVA